MVRDGLVGCARPIPCMSVTLGLAHGAQGVRGLKRDFWGKLRFYWVKMDFEEKIDAFGEKLDKNSQIKTMMSVSKNGLSP